MKDKDQSHEGRTAESVFEKCWVEYNKTIHLAGGNELVLSVNDQRMIISAMLEYRALENPPSEWPNYTEILKVKTDHYGETKAAYQFAAEEYARQYSSKLLSAFKELSRIHEGLHSKLEKKERDLKASESTCEQLAKNIEIKEKELAEMRQKIESLQK